VTDARNGKMPEGGAAPAAGNAPAANASASEASALPEAAAATGASEAGAGAAAQTAALPAAIYFDTGKSDLPGDAKAAIDAAAQYASAHADAKLTLSGYTDKTGSAAANADLAKRRAQAVRDALKAAGVAEGRIVLRKPQAITGGADAKQARRVEIASAA
jgi:cytochrome c oxidase subunit 2